jgi:hypothetical protein
MSAYSSVEAIQAAEDEPLAREIVDRVTASHTNGVATYDEWISAIQAYRERFGFCGIGRRADSDRYQGD